LWVEQLSLALSTRPDWCRRLYRITPVYHGFDPAQKARASNGESSTGLVAFIAGGNPSRSRLLTLSLDARVKMILGCE